jgi:hypothetical protein
VTGPPPCPLCGGADRAPLVSGRRRFFDCAACGLVAADRASLPSRALEREQYALHENDPADPRYRRFLSQLTAPLVRKLAPGAEGLDFGCGPGPAIRPILAEAGFRVSDYDPCFAPEDGALARRYDFITATEVVEHFHEPLRSFAQLDALLRPGGWLGVMTLLLRHDIDFASWVYVRDPTHVAFYRPSTLCWIARRFGWTLETDGVRVALFGKPAA